MGSLGYKMVPIAPGEKYPKVKKWQKYATDDQVTLWCWMDGLSGLGWAMGSQPNGRNLFAIDIDGEVGGDSLVALLSEHPESVDVFKNTVQQVTGSNGAHYVFEAPFEIRNSAKQFAASIDIRGEGGQIVVGPTIHPNGEPYRWVKDPTEFVPLMAPDWVLDRIKAMDSQESGRLPESLPAVSSPVSDQTPADWVREHKQIGQLLNQTGWTYMENRGQDQYWCRPGKSPKDGHSAIVHDNGVGPMVIWSTSAPAEFWRCGRDSRDGSRTLSVFEVFAACEHLGDMSRASSFVRRNLMPQIAREPEVERGTAPGSTVQPVEAPTAPDATNLPDEFWASRPWLAHIRQAAWNRQLSADAILGAVLTRYATIIPANFEIPAIVMAASTFDHISVLVAESGGGKSAAMSIARELFPGPQDRKDVVWDFPTPSGEGLVGAFFELMQDEEDGKKAMVNKKTKTAVHFSVDEALGLVESSGRQGATIGSVLCTAWSGGNPGQGNASADRKRVGMTPWTYRMSGLAAIQLSLGYRLMEDTFVQQGLSGRLVFFAAEDPAIPHWTERPAWPGPLELPVHPTTPTTIAYDSSIENEILEQNYLKQTKQVHVAPIDGHLNLVKLKLSGILALMDGRRTVTISDWNLAGMISDSHLTLRNRMLDVKKQATYERSVTAATAQAHFETTKDEVKERQLLARLRDSIIAKVPEEGITRSPLRKKVTSSGTKHRFDDALTKALDDGKIVERDGRYYPA